MKANVLFFDKKPASERPWTERLWVYDLRTNQHFTLKQNPLRREHLQEFVDCYRGPRVESERCASFSYDELIARDKVNLDISWLRDASLEDLDNLPAPEVIAREIVGGSCGVRGCRSCTGGDGLENGARLIAEQAKGASSTSRPDKTR